MEKIMVLNLYINIALSLSFVVGIFLIGSTASAVGNEEWEPNINAEEFVPANGDWSNLNTEKLKNSLKDSRWRNNTIECRQNKGPVVRRRDLCELYHNINKLRHSNSLEDVKESTEKYYQIIDLCKKQIKECVNLNISTDKMDFLMSIISRSYFCIAKTLGREEDLQGSLEKIGLALDFLASEQDGKFIARVYLNQGCIFDSLHKENLAKESYFIALQNCRKTNMKEDQILMANILIRLGTKLNKIYAEECYKRAFRIGLKFGDQTVIAMAQDKLNIVLRKI